MPESKHPLPSLPRFVVWLLDRLLDRELAEGILGDLQESMEEYAREQALWKARLRVTLQALGYLRYFRFKQQRSNTTAMLRNHLIIAVRSFMRHKVHSVINTLGLVIGLSAGFLILQYTHYESNYDQQWKDKERIYRVQQDRFNKGELTTRWAAGSAGIGPLMQAEVPEVEKMVRLRESHALVGYEEQFFMLDHAFYASEDFFSLFSVPLLRGEDSSVLNKPWTVALSESTARKFFGNEDPIGKKIHHKSDNSFTVTGVFADFPEHSALSADLLYSFKSYELLTNPIVNTTLSWDGFMTFVKLYPGTGTEAVEQKVAENIVAINFKEDIEQYGAGLEFTLMPLSDIHLHSDFYGEIKPNGDAQIVGFLTIIALFILFIAWINYINLATARSMQRAREVGIRKVLGSFRSQLFGQFMFESAFINVLSILLAILVITFVYPAFQDFVGAPASGAIPSDPVFWAGLAVLFLVGVLLSGFYPATVLSGFKPVTVLKGKFESTGKGNLLRRVLVVTQFITSVVLITGTFVVYNQLNHLRSQDLGFTIDQTLILETPQLGSDSVYSASSDIFKEQLLNEAQFKAVTSSSAVPGNAPNWNAGGVRMVYQSDTEANQYRIVAMDDHYIGFYAHELIAGRAFDSEKDPSQSAVIVNEAALLTLGIPSAQEAIGQKLTFWGDTMNVVGVVRNYHQESPKADYDKLIFKYFKYPEGYYSLKVSTNDMQSALKTLEQHWLEHFGDQPFVYFFLDDYYDKQYQTEMRFGNIFGAFSGLAIFVACLGLFGLASYATSLRMKEIGIRKVLGASLRELLLLLSRDFLKLVAIAVLISVPVSWYLLDLWLNNFASRVSLQPLLFIVPAMLVCLLAMATIWYHVIKTVRLNPAVTLKDE